MSRESEQKRWEDALAIVGGSRGQFHPMSPRGDLTKDETPFRTFLAERAEVISDLTADDRARSGGARKCRLAEVRFFVTEVFLVERERRCFTGFCGGIADEVFVAGEVLPPPSAIRTEPAEDGEVTLTAAFSDVQLAFSEKPETVATATLVSPGRRTLKILVGA